MNSDFYFYTRDLTVGYEGNPLVKHIEIHLKKGEILTLIGPNGAGKTTILRSIIRQLKPLGGVVFLDGKDLGRMGAKELSQKLSVVLTERIHPERMTCEQVVETGRYPYTGMFGVLSKEDHRIVKESLKLVHGEELAGEDFEKVSDGQRQRIMLARALSQEPELIVLDEPTSFLDVRHKLEFLSVLQELSRQQKLSVILSLHELDLAERISHKIACIKENQIHRFGSPKEIFTPGYIRELYQITMGDYGEWSGTPELQAAKGEPLVFVIVGNGKGTAVYRQLQRQGVPFATGILWENDLDYPAARMLAEKVVWEPAFCQIRPQTMGQAKRLIDQCKKVICPVQPKEMGMFYSEFLELFQYGKEKQTTQAAFEC